MVNTAMRIMLGFFLFLLVFLNYQLWLLEDQGMRGVLRLSAAVEGQRAENEVRAERNRALEAEVKSLKEGLDAIEELARVELGMIHRDETFFWILEEAPTTLTAPNNALLYD